MSKCLIFQYGYSVPVCDVLLQSRIFSMWLRRPTLCCYATQKISVVPHQQCLELESMRKKKPKWYEYLPGLNLCRHYSDRVDMALTLLWGGEIFRGEGSRLDIVKLGWSREGSRDTIERANTWASVRVDIYHQIFVICNYWYLKLGTGGVQGQVKGQRLMGIKAVNDSIGLATCQSKIYEK